MDGIERASKIQQVLIGVLILNWGVALAKLLYGSLIHSVSIKINDSLIPAVGTSSGGTYQYLDTETSC